MIQIKTNIFFKNRLKSRINSVRRYLIIFSLFILFIVPGFLLINMLDSASNLPQAKPSQISNTDSNVYNNPIYTKVNAVGNETVFGQPTLDFAQPTPKDTQVVHVPISDNSGIQNATLFWKYNTINNTEFNTSMNSGINDEISLILSQNPLTTNYNSTTPIFENGTSTAVSNRTLAVFEYDSTTLVNHLSVGLRRPNGVNSVYIKIERKNASTNLWQSFYKAGSINGTSNIILSTSSTTTFSDTNISFGYRLTVVAYISSGTNPQLPYTPNANPFTVQKDVYFASIPKSILPTQVTYYAKTFDKLNNPATSSIYSYLSDNPPTVSFYNTYSRISSSSPFNVSVKVKDLDNATDIKSNSVNAYYRLWNSNDWKNTTLKFASNVDNKTYIYNASINTGFLVGATGYVQMYVNASDNLGLQTKSSVHNLPIDNAGPSMTHYTMNGTYVASNIFISPQPYYVFNASQIPELFVYMSDSMGIKDVTLHYRVKGGSYNTIQMTNTTPNNANKTLMTFNATLPSYNVSKTIEWYITSNDFENNLNTSQVITFYFDTDAPTLVTKEIYPPYVSNTTQPLILFNVTDVVGVASPITLYYSYNNKETWSTDTISNSSTIDYSASYTYRNSTSFGYKYIPYQIPDNTISNISQQVTFPYTVDQAILNLGIIYTQGTYLRIWLSNDLGKKVVVFDRVSGSINTVYNIDLLKLGFTTKDFINSTFYLITEDNSLINYGQINMFNITLTDYIIPLGYQYLFALPATTNDTTGYYFFSFRDNFNYERNTSIYTFYADATPPVATITAPVNNGTTLDLKGASYLFVNVTASDKGGLFLIELYYKVNNQSVLDEWQILDIYLNGSTKVDIAFNLTLNNETGIIYYKVRVYDEAGFSYSTSVYKMDYLNANIPKTKHGGIDLVPFAVVGAIIVIGGVATYFAYPRLKRSGKLTAIKQRITSKRPDS